jgi:hypothetical protein
MAGVARTSRTAGSPVTTCRSSRCSCTGSKAVGRLQGVWWVGRLQGVWGVGRLQGVWWVGRLQGVWWVGRLHARLLVDLLGRHVERRANVGVGEE